MTIATQRANKRIRDAKWRKAHPAYWAKYHREHKDEHNSAYQKWLKAHADEVVAYRAEYYLAHKQELMEGMRQYAKDNAGRINAKNMRRYAAKLHATPPWLTPQHFADIEKLYVEAHRLQAVDGIKRHVDHIYPLRGKTLSGLHVPWNLQILTAAENRKKRNKIVI
jgi:hypothetical protein